MSQVFKTRDLYFAAFLKAAKVPWVGVENDTDQPRRVVFVFEKTTDLKELQHGYFARSSKVKIRPLNFVDEIRALKGMTYA